MFSSFLRSKSHLRSIPFQAFAPFSSSQQLRIFRSKSHSIYWNLATEEYFFEHANLETPTLFLYREDKTIIIGRHQNPWKECFLQQMKKDDVVLCRRKSGGGAVFHDLGNTCFSFLTPMAKELSPDKVKAQNNSILIAALKSLGIEATASGRNDLVIGEKKISGSAFKFNLERSDGTGRKYLHHGTMLINVNLDALQNYLNPNKLKLLSKGISSVRARVENMANINPQINHETLSEAIIREFIAHYGTSEYTVKDFSEEDMKDIPKIKEIYDQTTSWEWLYQKSPDFTDEMETRFDWGIVDMTVQVQGGVITDGKVFSDCLYPDFIDSLNEIIRSKTITYDHNGAKKVCDKLREKYNDHEIYSGYIKSLEGWLPTVF